MITETGVAGKTTTSCSVCVRVQRGRLGRTYTRAAAISIAHSFAWLPVNPRQVADAQCAGDEGAQNVLWIKFGEQHQIQAAHSRIRCAWSTTATARNAPMSSNRNGMNAPTPIVVLLAIITPTHALAATVSVQCPELISVEEIAKAAYPSWEMTADKGKVDVHLQSMLIYDGHPRGMASLTPDKTTEARGLLVATWRLPKMEADRGYWVGCAYRNSMTLLTKRLPDTVSTCRFTQKILRSGALAGVESFVCE